MSGLEPSHHGSFEVCGTHRVSLTCCFFSSLFDPGEGLGEVVSEIKGKPHHFHHEGRITMMIIRANIYTVFIV